MNIVKTNQSLTIIQNAGISIMRQDEIVMVIDAMSIPDEHLQALKKYQITQEPTGIAHPYSKRVYIKSGKFKNRKTRKLNEEISKRLKLVLFDIDLEVVSFDILKAEKKNDK